MKIVLDTNVLISGIHFHGPPYQILNAWRDGRVQIVLSPDILEEYRSVCERLSEKFPRIDIHRMIDLITINSDLIAAPRLPYPVCDDPDDDKFAACALFGRCEAIVTGDKHLLNLGEIKGKRILSPRKFVDVYL